MAPRHSQSSPAQPPVIGHRTPAAPGTWIDDRYEIQRSLGQPDNTTEDNAAEDTTTARAPVHSPIRTLLAWDHQTHSPVVLKALAFGQLHDWKHLDRFEQEAQALAQLSHPGIPQYLDYFEHRPAEATASTFYIVQAWIEGGSLGERVRRGDRFTEAEAVEIARQSLAILSYLHGLNPPVVHRDIKPDNLILSDEVESDEVESNEIKGNEPENSKTGREKAGREKTGGEKTGGEKTGGEKTGGGDMGTFRVHLVDFGAAQTLSSSGSTVMGTYGYMAPEQFRGQASPASDLYSLGATLLTLLTHRDPVALPTQRLQIDFRSVINLSDRFSRWLDGLLAPVAADRFPSAEQARAALDDPALTELYLQPYAQPHLQPHPQSHLQPRVGASALQASCPTSTTPNRSPSAVPAFSQPSDSAIRLTHRSGSYPLGQPSLSLDIPPLGLQRELWALGGFALLWNGGLLYWLIMAWAMDAPWFYPLVSAPFWGIGLLLLGRLGQSLFGQVRLLVQGNDYCLEQRLGPLCRTHRGALKDWQGVELRQQYRQDSEAVEAIALTLGLETVAFGTMLSPAEKHWLVEALQAFLAESRGSQ